MHAMDCVRVTLRAVQVELYALDAHLLTPVIA